MQGKKGANSYTPKGWFANALALLFGLDTLILNPGKPGRAVISVVFV